MRPFRPTYLYEYDASAHGRKWGDGKRWGIMRFPSGAWYVIPPVEKQHAGVYSQRFATFEEARKAFAGEKS